MAATDAEETQVIEEPKLLAGIDRADDLYEHLTQVLLKLIKATPAQALNNFESVSFQVKQEAAATSPQIAALTDEQKEKALAAALKQLHLIKAPKKAPALNEEGEPVEEEEEEEEKEQAPIPDIVSDIKLLSAADVKLDELLAYRMMLSIQKLATSKELQNVKFWGVIRGTQKDYYVVEAKLEEYPEEEGAEENSPVEAMGSGANECIYFVSNSAEGEWTKLPAVKPSWVIAARQMRRYLTGNLDEIVMGFPRFPWKEASYLRAQIARISHDCTIAPKGVMTVDEEAEPDEQVPAENEEYTGLNPYKGTQSANWQHSRRGLLKQGRVTPFVAEGEEEEEDEGDEGDEEKKPKEEKEKAFPPLMTLNNDKIDGSIAWKFASYPSINDPNAITTVSSLLWPGAVAVAVNKRQLNFYNGWALEFLSEPYAPPMYPAFQPEYNVMDDPKRAPKEEGTNPMAEQADPSPPTSWVPPTESEDKGEIDEGDDEDDAGAAPAGDEAEE